MGSKTHQTQLRKVFRQLQNEPQTMLQVSINTGILRANICRYIKTLRKRKLVAVTKIGKCPITKYKAHFFTTDKSLIPVDFQTKMVEGSE